MHCTARLVEMLDRFLKLMHSKGEDDIKSGNFLMEEVQLLEEAKGIWPPDFLSRPIFLTLLQKKLKRLSQTLAEFMTQVWGYVEDIVISIITQHSHNYPSLQSSSRRAATNLISRMKDQSLAHVKEIVEISLFGIDSC